jgi:hypothetical protein
MCKPFLGGKEQLRNKEENGETKFNDRQIEKPQREGERETLALCATVEGCRGFEDRSRDVAILDVECFRVASKCPALRH